MNSLLSNLPAALTDRRGHDATGLRPLRTAARAVYGCAGVGAGELCDWPNGPHHIDRLADRLTRLAAGRADAAERITAAARAAGAAAVLLIGSLATRTGDALSDVDLLIVAGPGYAGLDPLRLFGPQLVAQTAGRPGHPRGGTSTSICLSQDGLVVWLDLIEWPAATAAVPADALIVYLHLDLPYSHHRYSHLIAESAGTVTAVHPPTAAMVLQRTALAARHLARGNQSRIVEQIPQAAGLPLDHISALLHQQLSAIGESGMDQAIAGTAELIDVVETIYRRSDP